MLYLLIVLFVAMWVLEKLTGVRFFKPINNLPKLLIRLVMWVANDAVGNVLAVVATKAISEMPSEFLGANLIRPIVLIAVNAYFLYESIKDIREYKNWVSRNITLP